MWIPWRQLSLALYSLVVFTGLASVVNFWVAAYDGRNERGYAVGQLDAPPADRDYSERRAAS